MLPRPRLKEARRKSNKSSQGSIASSHSPATYRDATSHQANSIPKHHANDNCHGNRRGDGCLCQRSEMAASMRPQLLGQETFCEAFCFLAYSASAGQCEALNERAGTESSSSQAAPIYRNALRGSPLIAKPFRHRVVGPLLANGVNIDLRWYPADVSISYLYGSIRYPKAPLTAVLGY